MTKEEKAKKIAEFFNMPNGSNCLLPCHQAAMAMAEWMIDRACEWLEEHVIDYKYYDADFADGNIDVDGLIYAFKKSMEGGEE